jgi:prepilin peptidase CpaA
MEPFAPSHPVLPLAFAALLSALLLAVIYRDGRAYLIPNPLCAAIGLLFFPAAWLLGLPLLPALLAGLVTFLITFALFSVNAFGGGDAKLLTVLMLWTGWSMTSLQFLFLMAMLGGGVALVLLLLRAFLKRRSAYLPRLLQQGAPIPYGIPIALAFLLMLWEGRVFAIHGS